MFLSSFELSSGGMSARESRAAGAKLTVVFDPEGVEVQAGQGTTLLECARQGGARIASTCGGRGICKSCVVQVTEGAIPPTSSEDQQFFSRARLEKGWRRACQAVPGGDCRVHVPARVRAVPARVQVDGADFWVPPDPAVRAFPLAMNAATIVSGQIDANRLLAAVNNESPGACNSVDSEVLKVLPAVMHESGSKWRAVVRSGEIIAIQREACRLVGLAIDLGTTNIGVFLIDLHNGNTLADTGLQNPQTTYGDDVISRIAAAKREPDLAVVMQEQVIGALNTAVGALCHQRQVDPEDIVDVVVAGNTAMHHLFLGLSTDGLGMAPFTPVVTEATDVKARELGLVAAPGACIHMMANIAGFVGSDHTAMLLGIRADHEARTVVALDIGTNTEISLIHAGRILSLSCPSGPALEGGQITCGMRAAAGAIETVSIENDEVQLKTIDDALPIGLCGSAVIDATAAFYRDAGLTQGGRINEDYVHATTHEGRRRFRLYGGEPEVVFTQEDVRAVQLAKGAVRAGIDVLLDEVQLTVDQLDKIVVAGAFGNYLQIESACAIGMLPNVPRDRFEQIGNAAGIGAKLALLSFPMRTEASSLARRSHYLELAGTRCFNSAFMNAINFPEISGA